MSTLRMQTRLPGRPAARGPSYRHATPSCADGVGAENKAQAKSSICGLSSAAVVNAVPQREMLIRLSHVGMAKPQPLIFQAILAG